MPADGMKALKPILTNLAALAFVGGLYAPAPASADLYDWTLSGASTGAGTLTTGGADNGGFDILSFAGQINGALVSLDGTPLNPGPGGQTSPLGAFNYNNIVYAESGSSDVLDTYGILVSFAGSPDLEGNIWSNGGTSYSYYTGTNAGNYPISDTSDTFSIVAAPDPVSDPPSDQDSDPLPEPTALALLGSGLIGLAVVRRRWV
jgi:hypothetical protein